MKDPSRLPELAMSDPSFWDDIHAPLRIARSESRFARSPAGDLIALGYAEVEHILRSPQMETTDLLARSGLTTGPLHDWWSRVMFSSNPPEHTRLRHLVSRAFTPRRVEELRPTIATIADELLEEHLADGHIDLLHDYAHHLPIRVMSSLLAIPRSEYPTFAEWTADLGLTFSSFVNAELRVRLESSIVALDGYVRDLIERRRLEPGDDLLSALIAAEEEGDRLSNDELVAMVANLLFAGHDTTRSFLSIALPLLLEHPGQLALLRDRPELIVSAIEECLRFEPPVMGSARQPVADIEIDGLVLRKEKPISVSLPAANRDPSVFDDPDRFDICRFTTVDPRPAAITSFGQGIHFCLGAALARAEGQIGIERALQRLPGLEITEELRWVPYAHIRRYERVPASFEPAPSRI